MGQAKRRKDLGLYPEQTLKKAPKTRIKQDEAYGMDGMTEALALLMAVNRRSGLVMMPKTKD